MLELQTRRRRRSPPCGQQTSGLYEIFHSSSFRPKPKEPASLRLVTGPLPRLPRPGLPLASTWQGATPEVSAKQTKDPPCPSINSPQLRKARQR